ncbi:hypothetical protein ACFUG9_33995 [Streptomyces griseoincarnatus]
MRLRTAALTAALTVAALTGCSSSGDADTAAPTTSTAPAVDPADVCLADLVEAYPSLDPDVPMMRQVDTCEGLDDATKSSILETLSEYDDALQAAVDEASGEQRN